MVALADVITHGCNAVRYSVDKEKSEVVMVHCLPENITPSSMWDRMLILQQKYRDKINHYNHLYKTAIRIEVSPAKEETENWTMADWQKLADDFIREFDAQVYLRTMVVRRMDIPILRIASMSFHFIVTARDRFFIFISMPTVSTWRVIRTTLI